MPHHKSAKKRMKTNARDNEKNRAEISRVRLVIKQARASEGAEATSSYRLASSVLDKAVRKGVLKRSTANRYKSRLAPSA